MRPFIDFVVILRLNGLRDHYETTQQWLSIKFSDVTSWERSAILTIKLVYNQILSLIYKQKPSIYTS